MLNRKSTNISLFLIALSQPLFAEYIDVSLSGTSNLGFEILLYEPFNNFYMILVLISFISVNTYIAVKSKKSMGVFIAQSVVLYVCWFILAFLSVALLHTSLGGHM